ncbi:hypothetical protein ACWCPX_32255 [Streptomyces olivaceoviridis]
MRPAAGDGGDSSVDGHRFHDSAVPEGVVIARNGSAVCAGTGGFTP